MTPASVTTPNADEVLDKTLVSEEVVEAEETTQISGEADDEQSVDALAELKAQVAKFQADINKQKSAYQKKENDYAQREAKLKKQLDELRRAGMNEEDAKLYERDLALNELEDIKAQKAQLEQELAMKSQEDYWKDQFLNDYGIPRDKLVLDQGIEELVGSGMNAIKELLKSKQSNEVKPVKQAKANQIPPETLKPVKGDITSKMTLREAADKYADGDVDRLFKGFESGAIPRNIFLEIAEGLEPKD